MGLEMVLSKSARPESQQAILHASLLQRRAELRNGWQHLISVECLKRVGCASAKVSSFLSGEDSFRDWQTGLFSQWTDCDASLPACLLSIGVGENIGWRTSTALPAALSCADFKRLSVKDRLEALSVRYRCPFNIAVESESEIAEELLRQLMVADRAKLEAEAEFEVNDVLLKLNLTAVRARVNHDLRFLDAQNYYYELPQRSLVRFQRSPHLLAAWLCLYAQLLCAPDW